MRGNAVIICMLLSLFPQCRQHFPSVGTTTVCLCVRNSPRYVCRIHINGKADSLGRVRSPERLTLPSLCLTLCPATRLMLCRMSAMLAACGSGLLPVCVTIVRQGIALSRSVLTARSMLWRPTRMGTPAHLATAPSHTVTGTVFNDTFENNME